MFVGLSRSGLDSRFQDRPAYQAAVRGAFARISPGRLLRYFDARGGNLQPCGSGAICGVTRVARVSRQSFSAV